MFKPFVFSLIIMLLSSLPQTSFSRSSKTLKCEGLSLTIDGRPIMASHNLGYEFKPGVYIIKVYDKPGATCSDAVQSFSAKAPIGFVYAPMIPGSGSSQINFGGFVQDNVAATLSKTDETVSICLASPTAGQIKYGPNKDKTIAIIGHLKAKLCHK